VPEATHYQTGPGPESPPLRPDATQGSAGRDSGTPVEDRIAIAQARLGRDRPFLAPLIDLARLVQDDRVPTMAIDEGARVYWNRSFCAGLSVTDLECLLYHEVLHLLFRHPERVRALREHHPDWSHQHLNLAADLEVNDLLSQEEAFQQATVQSRILVTPETLGLPSNLTMEEYADLLCHPMAPTPEQDSATSAQGSAGAARPSGEDGRPDGTSDEGQPVSPSGSSPDPQAESDRDPQSGPQSRQAPSTTGSNGQPGVRQRPSGRGRGAPPESWERPGGSGHGLPPAPWERPGGSGHGLPPAPWERPADDPRDPAASPEAIQDAQAACESSVGTETGPIADRLRARKTPHLPWQRLLARYLRGPLKSPPIPGGFPEDYAYLRVHPAAPDPFLFPSLCGRRRRVGVVLDVSGSMQEQATRAMGEVRALVSQPDTEVLLVCCDVQVIWKGPWHRDLAIPWTWAGTDLRPAIGALASDHPSVILVITDGWTPWPDRPPSAPVIVCLLGTEGPRPPDWARTVVVPDPVHPLGGAS